ncbi:MAG: hypothetical protein KAT71_07425, partial [Gammaproteobacteria bacterium]|nr:hypothetical protein [Gammaproteobacteria bacterium]
GREIAEQHSNFLGWQRYVLELESDITSLLPGDLIEISDHPIAEINGNYRIIKLKDWGNQSTGQIYNRTTNDLTFHNKLTLIPANIPYCPEPLGPAPMQGIETAVVEGASNSHAYLDSLGRYRVRMHYDIDTKVPTAASNSVRLMQPASGKYYGQHFPLLPGTEVIYSCINGDINRPIVLGSAPNFSHPSATTSENYWQNILATPGGNQLTMDDTEDEEQILLATRDQQNLLLLDKTDDEHKIRLATQQGELNIKAAKTFNTTTAANGKLQIGKDHKIKVAGESQINSAKGIEFQSGQDMKFKAADKIDYHTKTKELSLKSERDTKIITQNLARINGKQNITLLSHNGAFYTKAQKSISLSTKNKELTIAQAGAEIQIAPTGEIILTARKIALHAKTNNLMGKRIDLNSGGKPAPFPKELTTPEIPDIKSLALKPIEFEPEPVEPVSVKIKYLNEDTTPIANAFYTARFGNGVIKQGQLDYSGTAELKDVPNTDYTVTFSRKSKADSEKTNLNAEKKQLTKLRARLKRHLDQILNQVKAKSRKERQVYETADIFQKTILLEKAELQGVWQALKQTEEGMVDLIETGAQITAQGGLAPLPLANAAMWAESQEGKQNLNATAEEIKTFWYILSDPELRAMVIKFANNYWDLLSVPAKFKTISDITSIVLIAIITHKIELPAIEDLTSVVEDTAETAEPIDTIAAWHQDSAVAANDLTANNNIGYLEFEPDVDTFGITDDPEVMLERKNRTIKFYETQGVLEDDIDEQLQGIDLTQPVTIEKISNGTELAQWQIPGAEPGNYYGTIEETPSRLGINPQVFDGKLNKIVDRIQNIYNTNREIGMLKSYTKPNFIDDFSIEAIPYTTQGGALQYFCTNKAAFTKID